MILSMYSQVIIFFITILLGILIAFLYDIFRIIRLNFYHKEIYVNLEDIMYWILSSFISFYAMLNINNGEIRLYSIIGIFLGMILYFITISKIIIKILNKIIKILKKYIKIIFNIIYIPINFMLKLYKIIITKTEKTFKPYKKYIKMKKKNFINDLKIIKRKL